MISRQHIPNALTLFRVGSVPVLFGLMFLRPDAHLVIFLLFVAAAISDFLDGYLARKWNVTSHLGAMLDPVADKLIVTLMLFYLMAFFNLALLPVLLIILRELYISGLRESLAARQIALPVSRGGKLKTVLQLAGIAAMLLWPVSGLTQVAQLGELCVWLSAGVALVTAVLYTRSVWPSLR